MKIIEINTLYLQDRMYVLTYIIGKMKIFMNIQS